MRPIPAHNPAPKLQLDGLDLEYKGTISYTMRWKGNQVEVVIEDDNSKVRAAIFAQAVDHLTALQGQVDSEKKKFTQHERMAIRKARWVLDKIATTFLMYAHEEIKNPK